jgi:hypothetical protein
MIELALSTSGTSSIDYAGNSLRYGLMDIRPIEVVETIKKFGVKFRQVTRTFEQLKPVETYADLVNFENKTIFGSVQIPKWFDVNKLVKTYSQHSIEHYEKDTEFKKAVEEVKQAERKGRPLLSFVQFARNRFESERDSYLEIEANRFLRSNFPLSFYNKLVVFDNTYSDFLKILEDKVRFSEFYASCARNFDMYKKKISEMQRIVSPIIDQMDTCFFQYTRIKKYVSIWNAKDYSEVFDPKYLDIKNVDFSEFGRLFKEYDTRLRDTRGFLLGQDSEIFSTRIDPKDSTARMFGKLVMLPSDSLDIKG